MKKKMKKLFLMGRSEAGKTSLTQALKGEELHYEKTQYTITADDTIYSPGEYAESKQFGAGLACFSFEADVVGIVQAALSGPPQEKRRTRRQQQRYCAQWLKEPEQTMAHRGDDKQDTAQPAIVGQRD